MTNASGDGAPLKRTENDRLRLWLIWLGLAALSLVLTSPGLHQGIGQIPEEVRRVSIGVDIASSGDLNPHWFGHPATLLLYALSLFYKVLELFGATGNLRDLYLSNPEPLFLIGRILARVAAAMSVVLTFELAKRLMQARWALLTAALTAWNPLFVMHAHRARADHILTLFLLLGILMLIKLQRNHEARQANALAALTGLAITFKYTAASLLGATLASLAGRDGLGRNWLQTALRLIAICLLVSFIASPFLYLDWTTSLANLARETGKRGGWNPLGSLFTMVIVSRFAFSDIGALVLAGACWRGLRQLRPLASWPNLLANRQGDPLLSLVLVTVAYSLQTFAASTYNPTWFTPLVPMLTIVIVMQLRQLPRWLGNKRSWVTALLLMTIVAHQWAELRPINQWRLLPGNTSTAERWLQSKVKPGQSVLLLQASEDDPHGRFPRIRVPRTTLLIATEGGEIKPVCQGEEGDLYTSDRPLSKEACFPRPWFRTHTREPLEKLTKRYDWVVLSNRKPPSSADLAWMGKLKPALELRRPPIQLRLSYPSSNNFPHGDYGVWQEVRIYQRQVSP